MPYKGWANRETWVIQLWITDDDERFHQTLALANAADESVEAFAVMLREWAEQKILPDGLDEVDWEELARATFRSLAIVGARAR